ncbi:protein PHLOEM PROTEIN 2-LIKE A10 [Nicotiana tabacum]|uniref:Protein PHLOEM PROTEIN 2-LIKE A10 n=2 Tax=Nicotiana TaxID=4085 RepID=A0A1S3YWX0_TOBAC|nr:PREDICTED: protein PHLOEM PROTEIN 2-LIKE A10-like [Nicotiana sylvestris]XP_016456674.1 PREDICTED: protein PHLOEM PROTEIN 2-LIKE A10-like [Nicotiana tabacum]
MALNYMDLKQIKKELVYTQKNKNLIVALGALGVTGFGAYKAYNSRSMALKRERLFKLADAVISLAEMVSDSADAIGIFSRDLKEFIRSESDQIPTSLKQILKIPQSDELSESVVKVTSALTIGFLKGYQQETERTGSGLFDQILNKLFSDAGSGFASVIVGNFVRNLVLSFYSVKQSSDIEYSVPIWIDALFQDKCRELIGNCVQLFVSTAVTVYLDRTMHINTYNEIFTGLTNPKNEAKTREMLVTICNGAVETFVKTSHQILTSTEMDSSALSVNNFKEKQFLDEDQDSEWMNKVVCSTLAMPCNKTFILDLSGRLIFECVKSFVEILLEKLYECLRRYVDFINEEIVRSTAEVYRCVSVKSSAVISLCLSLCVDILNGPWVLVLT